MSDSPSLASLQQQFSQALHYQTYTLPVEEGVADPDALLQVYRNNFVMTLSEYLEVVYPVVHALVGEDCFNALARHHVLNTPMLDARADQYGDGFDATINAIPNIIDAVPYLADIATLEWLIQAVNKHASCATDFPLDALAQVAPEDFDALKLTVAPSVRLLQSRFPAASIWHAVTDNDGNALQALDLSESETVLLLMNEQGIQLQAIDAEEASLIVASNESTLGGIDPELLKHIAPAVQRGVFEHFDIADQP
ncbi:DNA-binding domain-containing protein [Enterovibrio norvegicus]|uniref:HvfC/BufC N-terminal domain-containing protein n=1 Tax=Enterovibrio norvegicus TaxID=188144 RepID=UPI000C83FD38|nr:DNA-binding domain-containing protein [Enterovibrio norvegicus]PMN69050.1 DUF2063 domain-containing protein [Enterovibrio norvegicus]